MKPSPLVQTISQTASAVGDYWVQLFSSPSAEPFDTQATQMFEQFADQMQCMIYRCEVTPFGQTRVTYSNRAVEWIYEITREEIANDASPILSLVHPDDYDRIWKALAHSHQSGEPWHEQYRVVLPEKGTCWREARATVNLLEDGRTIWHGFVWDITTEKQTEIAKDQFFALMGHDLRTPITGVLGCAEMLKTTSLEESQSELIQMIEASGNHLLLLISDLLDLSKIQAGKLILDSLPFSPFEACNTAHGLVQPQATLKGIQLDVELDPLTSISVIGDSLRFTQIVTNLLANAIKHGANERIRLTAIVCETQGALDCRIRVEDDGPGVQPENRKLIFEAYSQLDRQTAQSSGLGLALASKLARQMSGGISVADSDLGGALFEFHSRLPKSSH